MEIIGETQTEITDIIKSFSDACKFLRIKTHGDAFRILKLDRRHLLDLTIDECDDNYLMLQIIAKALVGDWIPNYEDENQKKHFPYFEYRAGSGFVFSRTYYLCTSTYAASGSRLCFPNAELAEYFAKQFITIHNKILV